MTFRPTARPCLRAIRTPISRQQPPLRRRPFSVWQSRSAAPDRSPPSAAPPVAEDAIPRSRLNPAPDDYAASNFADKARITMYAGPGGSGCIGFLREAFFPNGPANGGDGGRGGNVYIQAVAGETSLHKISRRRFVRAGKGTNGRGDAQAGQRGEDVIITVPVGTVVTEVSREDPVADEAALRRIRYFQRKKRRREILEESGEEALAEEKRRELEENPDKDKWVLYPGLAKHESRHLTFPRLPRRARLFAQPPAPIRLDLSRPTPQPILLATGGLGGLGNPHFVSRDHPRPVFATRGEDAMTVTIDLELKLLADVGLVGLPNAGKSTLLRALTNSRARVGDWAFTTLQPNIGTVVLDKYSGRPAIRSVARPSAAATAAPGLGMMPEEADVAPEPRTRFTVADIPGLIEGAHLDRGLGIEFLRHVERARVLAFVVDLSAGNAVETLTSLWNEVALYAQMRGEEERAKEIESRVDWDLMSSAEGGRSSSSPVIVADASGYAPPSSAQSTSNIVSKPWFVVATKADLPETKENYGELKKYVEDVQSGELPHPTGMKGAWKERCAVVPVSAIHGHNVEGIVHWTVGLLEDV